MYVTLSNKISQRIILLLLVIRISALVWHTLHNTILTSIWKSLVMMYVRGKLYRVEPILFWLNFVPISNLVLFKYGIFFISISLEINFRAHNICRVSYSFLHWKVSSYQIPPNFQEVLSFPNLFAIKLGSTIFGFSISFLL